MFSTTVPSFFSRIYETVYAFQKVTQDIHVCHVQEKRFSSGFNVIVSETLDILEFIFLYGNSLEIESVDQSHIQSLKNSDNEAHRFLADLIEGDRQMDKLLSKMQRFDLFVSHGKCIGGTSPYTLVYPSPNLSHLELDMHGLAGNLLFKDIVPLFDRGDKFKNLMFALRHSYRLPEVIQRYIAECHHYCQIHDDKYRNSYYDMSLLEYDTMKRTDGSVIDIDNTPLYRIFDVESVRKTSEYLLCPKKGKNIEDEILPLVLSQTGIDKANYVMGAPWQAGFYKDMHFDVPIEERVLPGIPINFPYVGSDDFLEDDLIEVDDKEIEDCFSILTTRERRFLLPLKPLFFKYFSKEDLDKMLTITEDDGVMVFLKIPVVAGYVNLSKKYAEYSIRNSYSCNIAVLPFYKLPGEKYTVLSYSPLQDTTLKFIDSATGRDIESFGNVDFRQSPNVPTSYQTVDDWDVIGLHYGDSSALLIPKFIEYSDSKNDDSKFSVYISDTFTYVKHGHHNGSCRDLVIIEEYDSLIGTLTKFIWPRSIFGFGESFFQSGSMYSRFPLPSRMCLRDCAQRQNPSLYDNAYISFDYDAYSHTVLMSPDNVSTQRDREKLLELYCEEWIQILKAKSLRESKSSYSNLDVVIPSWLKPLEVERYKIIWRQSCEKQNVCSDNIRFSKIEDVIVANILSFSFSERKLAIFIDGKHTDIVYANMIDNVYKSLSIPFGADDVLGEGCALYGVSNRENPYVYPIIQDKYSKKNDIIREIYFRTQDMTVSEIVKWYEGQGCGSLPIRLDKAIGVFVAVISLYIAQFLNKYNLEMPHKVIFSGVGAEILHLSETIQPTLESLIKHFGGNVEFDLGVEYQYDVVSHFPLQRIIEVEKCCVYGIENEDLNTVVNVADVKKLNQVAVKSIMDKLQDEEVLRILSKAFGLCYDEIDWQKLTAVANWSFLEECRFYCDRNQYEDVYEPICFWALKGVFACLPSAIIRNKDKKNDVSADMTQENISN